MGRATIDEAGDFILWGLGGLGPREWTILRANPKLLLPKNSAQTKLSIWVWHEGLNTNLKLQKIYDPVA